MKLSRLALIIVQVVMICVLLSVCNLIVAYSHLPIPGSILGLVILALLMIGKVLPERWVADGGGWLLGEILLFFIPPCISLLKYQHLLIQNGLGIVLLLLVGTPIVMGVVVFVVDRVFHYEHRRLIAKSAAQPECVAAKEQVHV